MLKLILISLFTISIALAHEPEGLFIVSNGKMNQVNFKDLKRVEITTINHHPKFKTQGPIKYSGYLVKDILSQVKLSPDDYVTIVGKTGQFSVEVSVKELLAPNNIIATQMNGVPLKTEEKGLQIIYSADAVEKFPHLKDRYYWCWWVRSFITDEKFSPRLTKANATLESILPWPVPHGTSSRKILDEVHARSGRVIMLNKAKVNLLNGQTVEVESNDKTRFFLTDSMGNKAGAYGLHQIVEKEGRVHAFVTSLYYVKSLEVIK